MLDVQTLKAEDLKGLSPSAMAEVSARMLEHIAAQARQIEQHEQTIKFKDAKLEKVTFELARLKAWKFGAKTEAMNAEQRRMFEETLAEDEASLQAQPRTDASPSGKRCPSTCDAWSTTTSPRTRPARRSAVVDPWCAWAKTSARSSTSCRPSSSCIATSMASGRASAARCWCKSP